MLKMILPAMLVAIAAPAAAQSLSDTHEQVMSPGKSHVQYRPISRDAAPKVRTCHPEASKALSCTAYARAEQQEMMAQRKVKGEVEHGH